MGNASCHNCNIPEELVHAPAIVWCRVARSSGGRIVQERNGIPRLGFIKRRSRLDEAVGWERCAIVGQLLVVYTGCDLLGVRQHELAMQT